MVCGCAVFKWAGSNVPLNILSSLGEAQIEAYLSIWFSGTVANYSPWCVRLTCIGKPVLKTLCDRKWNVTKMQPFLRDIWYKPFMNSVSLTTDRQWCGKQSLKHTSKLTVFCWRYFLLMINGSVSTIMTKECPLGTITDIFQDLYVQCRIYKDTINRHDLPPWPQLRIRDGYLYISYLVVGFEWLPKT